MTSSLQRVMITQLMPGGNLKNYLDAIAVNTRYHNCTPLVTSHVVQQTSSYCITIVFFSLYSGSQATDPALPTTLLKLCCQVAEGLSYLAGKSLVHRDIAARNILLDQELNCKVSILIIGEVMHGCTTNHTFKYINLYSCIASLIKLSGFGMTRDLSEEDYYTVKAGRGLHIDKPSQ